MKDRLMDASKELIIYGSDEVIAQFQKYLAFTQNPAGNTDGIRALELYAEMIVLIRKDMGNPDTCLTYQEVLRQILGPNYDKLVSHQPEGGH